MWFKPIWEVWWRRKTWHELTGNRPNWKYYLIYKRQEIWTVKTTTTTALTPDVAFFADSWFFGWFYFWMLFLFYFFFIHHLVQQQSSRKYWIQVLMWPQMFVQRFIWTKTSGCTTRTPPPSHYTSSFTVKSMNLVAVMVWFEGPIYRQTQVLRLVLCQLGQLHPQFVQMRSCDFFIQLRGEQTQSVFLLKHKLSTFGLSQ